MFNTSSAGWNLTGSYANDLLFGGNGNDRLNGGSGSDVLIGGKGNDVLTGGSGNDRFVFDQRDFGQDTIIDFSGGDVIDVSGLGITDLATLQHFMSQDGSNVTITTSYFGTPESITIDNTQVSELTASSFVFATGTPASPFTSTVNDPDGTSYLYTFSPSSTVTETAAQYSAANGSGTQISIVVNNTDGTSLIYAYNPTSTVTETASRYSSFDSATGAPTGARVSEVVDNTDNSVLVYAYNPSSTVTLTATRFATTDPSNGAPTGAKVSAVVDNSDGTSLVYAYNPSSTVTQTTTEFSGTDSATGAPTGSQVSAVVDNTDGTSVVYAYNPSSTVTLTASNYSSTDTSSGAPAGQLTHETFDYTNGESSITTYGANDSQSTVYYSDLNGTGSILSGPSSAPATQSGPGSSIVSMAAAYDNSTILISASNQLVDPGTGPHTIQFASGAVDDTLVLHLDGSDQIMGFDPAAGDMLDLRSLLSEANMATGTDPARLEGFLTIVNDHGSAAIRFDPTGQGGGSQVALLVNDRSHGYQLQSFKAFTT